MPTLRLRRAWQNAPSGAVFRLLADDPLARIDVPHFAREAGLEVVSVEVSGEEITVLLKAPVASGP